MKILKTWLKTERAQAILSVVLAGLIWLFYLTVRWQRRIDPETRALLEAGKPVIICYWHGRMFYLAGAWRKRPNKLGFLNSAHRDGRLIGRALERVGYTTVLGSSRRGGAAALREMSRLLRAGMPMAITPDGPKGPRMRAKAGAVKAAQITGVPLVAFTGSAAPRKLFKTWDRFCLPLPLARAPVYWGPPIYVPRDADAETLESCRRAVEESLNSLTNEAERSLGQEETQAAPEADANGRAKGRADGARDRRARA